MPREEEGVMLGVVVSTAAVTSVPVDADTDADADADADVGTGAAAAAVDVVDVDAAAAVSVLRGDSTIITSSSRCTNRATDDVDIVRDMRVRLPCDVDVDVDLRLRVLVTSRRGERVLVLVRVAVPVLVPVRVAVLVLLFPSRFSGDADVGMVVRAFFTELRVTRRDSSDGFSLSSLQHTQHSKQQQMEVSSDDIQTQTVHPPTNTPHTPLHHTITQTHNEHRASHIPPLTLSPSSDAVFSSLLLLLLLCLCL